MHRVYEIFEVLPNGSRERVAVISGLDLANERLQELANHTRNECFAADARTRQIVALMNVPRAKWRAVKHIFQISYDEQLGLRRGKLLKSHGYSVASVIGNDATKVVLSPTQHYDLFIIGHETAEETRQEIVLWLKAKYPRAKVLALNPPNQEVLHADYNVWQDGTENWLLIVSRELANSFDNPGPVNPSTSST